jgi:hypothetical protein
MKTFKEVAEDIVNKMEEDKYIKMGTTPLQMLSEDGTVGANVALPPAVEPGVKKKDDDKRDPLMFGKYKTFKRKLKENNDNNNIMLKQVLDSIDRVEQKIDEKNGFKDAEVTVEAEKEYISFRDKYKA